MAKLTLICLFHYNKAAADAIQPQITPDDMVFYTNEGNLCSILKNPPGDFLFFLREGDILANSAFETIRAVVGNTSEPHLFAMLNKGTQQLGELYDGQVGIQQLVVPNDPRIPKSIESDGSFVRAVSAAWDGKLHIHNNIIAITPA